jgi:NAD(P)-dependent dehydrogenase (short-subunit alcohol dehydrogenase family)
MSNAMRQSPCSRWVRFFLVSPQNEAEASAPLRTILITGGGSGIGAALATELARRGSRVLITGRRRSALEEVAGRSEQISMCVGDVTDPTHRTALATALADLPGPRAIFHAAGYFQTGLLDALSIDDWRRSFETNVEARWALSCACSQLLDGGRVLFIGSDAGANPRAGAAAYSIAQAASETLRRALQAEWANSRRAIGAFKPGLVDTDMVRGFMELPLEEFPARSAYEDYATSGQIASTQSIARFAAWLLLDVSAGRFTDTDWDIRDTEHHAEWSESPLYPNAISQQ